MQPFERTARCGDPPTDLGALPPEQFAERCEQQPVLVGDVVGDQARRHAGFTGDVCESRALDADFCETFEGDLDELLGTTAVSRTHGGTVGGDATGDCLIVQCHDTLILISLSRVFFSRD